ncbi:MAG TPA: hypothetical protein VGS98_03355 [Thermoanaerobaculia bacterium]|jgi:hypothetical protein|nr:hypothetical protein [Thermoanaerobaculia bacterium]
MIRRYFSAAAGALPVACLYGAIRASGYEGGWVLPVGLVFGLLGAEIGWRLSERRLLSVQVARRGEVAQATLKPSGSAAVITLLSPVSRADVMLVTFPDKVTAIAPAAEYHDLRELVG